MEIPLKLTVEGRFLFKNLRDENDDILKNHLWNVWKEDRKQKKFTPKKLLKSILFLLFCFAKVQDIEPIGFGESKPQEEEINCKILWGTEKFKKNFEIYRKKSLPYHWVKGRKGNLSRERRNLFQQKETGKKASPWEEDVYCKKLILLHWGSELCYYWKEKTIKIIEDTYWKWLLPWG